MHNRSGLTLVEIIVVLVVIAILTALILVGVQKARESARRISCANNLRQIGLGVAMYESNYRCFPQAKNSSGSFLVAILPFTEQTNLANEVTSFVNRHQDSVPFQFRSPLYLCPSDSAPQNQPGSGASGSNYCGNSGSWTASAKKFDGIFQYLFDFGFGAGIVRPSDVTDGLTNTGCVSEWLRADNTFARMRVNWNTPDAYPIDRAAFSRDCNAIPDEARRFGWEGNKWDKGTPWYKGDVTVTLYNHVATPNSPNCYNRSGVPTAAASASSNHFGGVMVMFADGHVDFISESVDSEIWFSHGSRSGEGQATVQ